MKTYNEYFAKKYGKGEEIAVQAEGQEIEGLMYGNDECYEGDRFYQVLVTGDRVYHAYYTITDDVEDVTYQYGNELTEEE